MIYGNIKWLGKSYEYPEKIFEMLKYLKNIDISEIPLGIHEIEGKQVYIEVIEVGKLTWEERKAETHQKYIDIQFSANGKEQYGFAPESHQNNLVENLLAERDILFFNSVAYEKYIDSNPGDFFVFFPNDVHRSIYKYGDEPKLRKAIIKVAVELL
ncbi:Hypothetical protein LUCI_1187 [Lucifera butyrica]|uniref:Uncharacterized protein n=1 Tax=Lucifera butyrica TaxID=1351585 RepID=A0A498R0E2_9FIRM|nr:YhcH/YjgK/YiaL family protein [Lucifera butyrica]VBB05976.1 Hypothetical protein LUCI_1187 [Lucifera butyrica]